MLTFFRRYWRSTGFLLFSIFLFTHNFHGSGGPGIPHFDKFVHFCLFSGLVSITLFDTRRKPEWRNWIIFSILGYGISIEVFQGLFLPYRTGNLLDVIADTAGVIAGVLSYRIYKNSRFYKPAVD